MHAYNIMSAPHLYLPAVHAADKHAKLPAMNALNVIAEIATETLHTMTLCSLTILIAITQLA